MELHLRCTKSEQFEAPSIGNQSRVQRMLSCNVDSMHAQRDTEFPTVQSGRSLVLHASFGFLEALGVIATDTFMCNLPCIFRLVTSQRVPDC